jgi:hypothetical protein
VLGAGTVAQLGSGSRVWSAAGGVLPPRHRNCPTIVIGGFFLLGGDVDSDTEGEFDVDVPSVEIPDVDVDPGSVDVEEGDANP